MASRRLIAATVGLALVAGTMGCGGNASRGGAGGPATDVGNAGGPETATTHEEKYASGNDRRRVEAYRDKNGLFVFHGSFTEWYPDGQVRVKGQWSHGKRDGRWLAKHEDGTTWVEGQFDKGKPTGTWTYYDLIKNVSGRREDGRKTGPWRESDLLGETIGEGRYQNGKMHGPWSFRSMTGEPIMDVDYHMGVVDGKVTLYQPIKMAFVFSQGREVNTKRTLEVSGETFSGDDPHYGEVVRAASAPNVEQLEWVPRDGPFDPPSIVVREESWPEGTPKMWVEYTPVVESGHVWRVRHGEAKSWYRNGEQESLQHFEMGVEHGVFQAWHSDGSPKFTVHYSRGLPTGTWKFSYQGGGRRAEGKMSPSGECQDWYFWDQEGRPIRVDRVAEWLQQNLH